MAWFCKFKDDLCNRCYLFDIWQIQVRFPEPRRRYELGCNFTQNQLRHFLPLGNYIISLPSWSHRQGPPQGSTFCLRFSHLQLTKDHVLQAHVMIFSTIYIKKIECFEYFWLTWRVFCVTSRVFFVTSRVFWIINRVFKVISLMSCIFSMCFVFSMFSQLTPRSAIQDGSICRALVLHVRHHVSLLIWDLGAWSWARSQMAETFSFNKCLTLWWLVFA